MMIAHFERSKSIEQIFETEFVVDKSKSSSIVKEKQIWSHALFLLDQMFATIDDFVVKTRIDVIVKIQSLVFRQQEKNNSRISKSETCEVVDH